MWIFSGLPNAWLNSNLDSSNVNTGGSSVNQCWKETQQTLRSPSLFSIVHFQMTTQHCCCWHQPLTLRRKEYSGFLTANVFLKGFHSLVKPQQWVWSVREDRGKPYLHTALLPQLFTLEILPRRKGQFPLRLKSSVFFSLLLTDTS